MSKINDSKTSTMQFPKPPTAAETAKKPDETFTWIEARIAEIYATGRYEQQQRPQENSLVLDQAAYLQIYSTVHAYCKPSRRGELEPRLYRSLQQAIRAHCREVAAYIEAQASGDPNDDGVDTILATYLEQWKIFLGTSVRVRSLFSPLEKPWVWRAIDSEPPLEDVYLFPELHRRYWREEVLGVNDTSKGSSKVLEVVNRRQQNEGQSQKLADDVTATFDDLKVALADDRLVAVDQ